MSKKGENAQNHNYYTYVKKVKKWLDNNSQFELKIAQFYVFQGKKTQNQSYFRSKKSKKYSIIRWKNTDILKKILKDTLIIDLKIRKKMADSKARFEWNVI